MIPIEMRLARYGVFVLVRIGFCLAACTQMLRNIGLHWESTGPYSLAWRCHDAALKLHYWSVRRVLLSLDN